MEKVTQIILIVVLLLVGGMLALDKINNTRAINISGIEKKIDTLSEEVKKSKCTCNHGNRGSIGAAAPESK